MQQVNLKEGSSTDIIENNINHLKKLFPDAFTEDGIDFNTLRQLLGDLKILDENEEKYGLNWHGKKQARKIALTPSLGTLLPCKEESVDWDNTKNLFIEGDNLEVLKLLQRSYANKVKMIYIDPPYNTGKEFVYPDKFQDNLDTYLKYTGQKGDEGERFTSNTESSGRKHTNWLNMMYPRLKLARDLLKEDGVIFISIDDNEQANLKKICDDVFGEESLITTILWKRKNEISSDSKNVAVQGEYILAYAKSLDNTEFLPEPLSTEYIAKSYKEPTTEYPHGKWRPVPITVSKGLGGGGYEYEIKSPSGKRHTRLWAYPKKRYEELLAKKMIYFGAKEDGIPQRVIYANESNGQPITNYWDNVAKNKEGKKEVLDLFEDNIFDTPKPTNLIKKLIGLVSKSDANLILDFFSGSSTTAHAVMQLNAEDGGSRRHIMVQLPEHCDPKSEAYKAGYKNIADIGKERIRRAAKKIKEENPEYKGDLGFKVFKLASSNIKTWNPDRSDLEQSLSDYVDHLKKDRSEQDILYELLLKRGVDLATTIETRKVIDKNIYSIGSGKLITCLDDNIDNDNYKAIADAIIEWQKELKNKLELKEIETHVFFKDSAFDGDVAKTNMVSALSQGGIEHVRSL